MYLVKRKKSRSGAVLLVVLIIIMVITILSLGFLSKSDVELACGRNMILREQMDYLAESGLEQAKVLILNPQDLENGCNINVAKLQLADGSYEYYDISVEPNATDHCNYIIDSSSYQWKNEEKVGQSKLRGYLRLDPCITFWSGDDLTLTNSMTINGDVYCDGILENSNTINGDVFSLNISKTGLDITGQLYSTSDLPSDFNWPEIIIEEFDDKPEVSYHSGNYTLSSDIEKMLLVDGDLTIQDSLSLTINPAKNLPALYVTGNLIVGENTTLYVNGLAVVDGHVFLDSGANITNMGALFTKNGVFEIARDSSANDTIATLYNGVEKTDGRINGSLRFDGVDDYVKVENEIDFDIQTQITVAAWIKVDSFNNNFQAIVTKGDQAWRLQRYSSSNTIEFACTGISITSDPTNSYGNIISNTEIGDGAWHHVAGVYDGATIYIYIDGVLDNSEPATGLINTNDYDVLIGNNAEQSGRNWDGRIDDVQIYNTGLDSNDITNIKSGFTKTGLIGHWKFDEIDSEISITAAPEQAAILLYDVSGTETKWGQAAGAFFKSIERR